MVPSLSPVSESLVVGHTVICLPDLPRNTGPFLSSSTTPKNGVIREMSKKIPDPDPSSYKCLLPSQPVD